MVKIRLNLPPYRLTVALRITKRRRFSWKRLVKASLKRARELEPREVKVFFNRAFAHKSIKKILGTNLAFALILTSFVPTHGVVEAEAQGTIIAEAQTVLKTEKAMQYPVEEIRITQGYAFFHPGIDLDGLTGDPIRPVKKGRVKEISRSRFSYGNSVTIEHEHEVFSLYAHLSEIDVEPDQEVTTETVIGKMGATGRSFGDHLHLEIRQNGRALNPTTVLPR